MESIRHVAAGDYHWKRWAAIAASLFILFTALFIIIKISPDMSTNASINGIIFDAASGKPVPNAIIMITGGTHEHPDIASQSDENGSFALPALEIPGTYNLLINNNEVSKELTININNKDTVLKIPL